jgi:hypothetical protein
MAKKRYTENWYEMGEEQRLVSSPNGMMSGRRFGLRCGGELCTLTLISAKIASRTTTKQAGAGKQNRKRKLALTKKRVLSEDGITFQYQFDWE